MADEEAVPKRNAEFTVKWSRPGLDQVRVGKGRALGFNADGSLLIVDDDGRLRAIRQEHVKRRVKVGSRLKYEPWTEADDQALRDTMETDAGETPTAKTRRRR